MFIDQIEIKVVSGAGGDGSVHFRKEKYVPFGGPDGGDGGKGGDVILEVNKKLATLFGLKQRLVYSAPPGKPGAKQKMTGRSGDDLIIMVPAGTQIFELPDGRLIADLVDQGQRFCVVKGGRGGRGNIHFSSSRNQVPKIAEKGEPAVEKSIRLELKLIADVGIIGLPNVGKSTFLNSVTNAKSKIGEYPFTTLDPELGVANLDEDRSVVLADIPGLVEGAHRGIGLGTAFLKHIQRTRVLIHLLDATSEDIVSDFSQTNSELGLFDPKLKEKPQIVTINKIDLLSEERAKTLVTEFCRRTGQKEVNLISAMQRIGLDRVLRLAWETIQSLPDVQVEPVLPLYQNNIDPRDFRIEKTDEGYVVHGEAIERAAKMTYWEHYQSIRRFQQILKSLGVEEGLRLAGVKEGDTVIIADHILEWFD